MSLDDETFRSIARETVGIFYDIKQFKTEPSALARVKRVHNDWKEGGYKRPIYKVTVQRYE
jgi:hypothetical protein